METTEEVELTTLSWLNNTHLLKPAGQIPPMEAENDYYRQTLLSHKQLNKKA